MKRNIRLIAVLSILFFVASCGILKNSGPHGLYSKSNREKAKVKNGLFSSKRASFGSFSTSSIKKGIDKRIIDFRQREDPFHFTLSENKNEKVKVQAVKTVRKSFKNKRLPGVLQQNSGKKLFYAWISGSAANNLNNWELIIENPSYKDLEENEVVGVLRSQGEKMEIHAHNRSGNKGSYDELTYEFQLKGIPVAAVQVNGRRKYVWMQPEIKNSMKYVLSGAISALLLR